jgi:hypothetical protein
MYIFLTLNGNKIPQHKAYRITLSPCGVGHLYLPFIGGKLPLKNFIASFLFRKCPLKKYNFISALSG